MKAAWNKFGWIFATVGGSAVFALGFALFLQPNDMNAGGISGLAQVIVELLDFGSVGLLSVIINLRSWQFLYKFLNNRAFRCPVGGSVIYKRVFLNYHFCSLANNCCFFKHYSISAKDKLSEINVLILTDGDILAKRGVSDICEL